jgi:hypothetical protein
LALLVDAQHQGVVGWIEIEPDDVAKLLDEEWIVGQLERLGAMGLHPEQMQVALHGAFAELSGVRQTAHAPVRAGGRLFGEGHRQ